MILYGIFSLALVALLMLVVFWRPKVTRSPLVMIQWGAFTNSRPGVKNHPYVEDEPEFVDFRDYRYWIRVKSNPGFNLPVIGYWSKHRGRRRR